MPKAYNKIIFCLIAEQILAFASDPNMVIVVKICLQILSKLRDDVLRYLIFSFESLYSFTAKL